MIGLYLGFIIAGLGTGVLLGLIANEVDRRDRRRRRRNTTTYQHRVRRRRGSNT